MSIFIWLLQWSGGKAEEKLRNFKINLKGKRIIAEGYEEEDGKKSQS